MRADRQTYGDADGNTLNPTGAKKRSSHCILLARRINEVTLRRARLALGWVTVIGRVWAYHFGM